MQKDPFILTTCLSENKLLQKLLSPPLYKGEKKDFISKLHDFLTKKEMKK